MWSWANENYPDAERARFASLQVFGKVRGIPKVADGYFRGEEVDAWEVTQIAAYLLGAEAIYRAPMEHLLVFLLLHRMRSESLPARFAGSP